MNKCKLYGRDCFIEMCIQEEPKDCEWYKRFEHSEALFERFTEHREDDKPPECSQDGGCRGYHPRCGGDCLYA